jgi:hypothetical protein
MVEAQWLATDITRWIFHANPTEIVDVAVLPLPRNAVGMVDHSAFELNSAATDAVIEELHIGLGEDVFLVGLFANHHGKRRNIPIVRFGNIAAMREEHVNTKSGDMDVYLIEARSIGGLSGSPVFVHLGNQRRVGNNQVMHANSPEGVFYLLGLMHGHWDVDESKIDGTADVKGTGKVNMGIAMVVPVQNLWKLSNNQR